jgi:hypothetical protein
MNARIVLIPLLIPAAAVLLPCGLAADSPVRPASPDILVVRDGWETDRETVRKTLESTAAELWRYFPNREVRPIIVYPQGGPVTLFQRGPNGEIFIRLNTGKTFWAQYAFQFSHELCHVLCQYDADEHGNDWFEEALCELASMFTLRRMGETWKTSPPFAHWKDFAPHLTTYAEDLIRPARLPAGKTLAAWYAEHGRELQGTATNREMNRVVAAALLPLFEQCPEHWEAVTYLNEGSPPAPQSFREFVTDWHQHAPEQHRDFIRRIAAEFGITIQPPPEPHR